MKTTRYTLLLTALIAAASHTGCKKGEGDPFISLSSRKARVEGSWNVSRYEEVKTSSDNNSVITSTSIFDGSSWTDTYSTSGGTSTQMSTGTFTYTFTKDGDYTMKRSISTTTAGSTYTNTREEEGKWDFLTGVGELKNKEFIGLTITKQTFSSGTSTGTTTYVGQPYSVWQITTLKNKEMVLNLNEENLNSSNGGSPATSSNTTTITLTQ